MYESFDFSHILSDHLYVFLIAVLLIGIAIGIVLIKTLRSFWQRIVLFLRFRRGDRAEQWALKKMRKDGYTLVGSQSVGVARVRVNGNWITSRIRIDYIFEKNGKRFGLEVKSGKYATDPASAATRRQLLEYFLVYEIDTLMLADFERKEVIEIYFDIPGAIRE